MAAVCAQMRSPINERRKAKKGWRRLGRSQTKNAANRSLARSTVAITSANLQPKAALTNLNKPATRRAHMIVVAHASVSTSPPPPPSPPPSPPARVDAKGRRDRKRRRQATMGGAARCVDRRRRRRRRWRRSVRIFNRRRRRPQRIFLLNDRSLARSKRRFAFESPPIATCESSPLAKLKSPLAIRSRAARVCKTRLVSQLACQDG